MEEGARGKGCVEEGCLKGLAGGVSGTGRAGKGAWEGGRRLEGAGGKGFAGGVLGKRRVGRSLRDRERGRSYAGGAYGKELAGRDGLGKDFREIS